MRTADGSAAAIGVSGARTMKSARSGVSAGTFASPLDFGEKPAFPGIELPGIGGVSGSFGDVFVLVLVVSRPSVELDEVEASFAPVKSFWMKAGNSEQRARDTV